MLHTFTLILGALWTQQADAGVVVWLESDVPDQKVLDRADNKTGGTDHVSSHYLAFPPQPETADDGQQYENIRNAIGEGLLIGVPIWLFWNVVELFNWTFFISLDILFCCVLRLNRIVPFGLGLR